MKMMRGMFSVTCGAWVGVLVTLGVTAVLVYLLLWDVALDAEAELQTVLRAYLASSRNTSVHLRQLEDQMNALHQTAATNNDHMQTVLLRVKRLIARAQRRFELFND